MVMRFKKYQEIGQVWYATFNGDELINLKYNNYEAKPKFGQEFCGRVKDIDKRLNGAFIDIGFEKMGFLPFRSLKLNIGQAINLRIIREEQVEKGAVLELIGEAKASDECPKLIKDISFDYEDANQDEIIAIKNAINSANEKCHNIENGGRFFIEPTRALIAIDIDAGGRNIGAKDKANFTQKLNLDAAKSISKILKLYNIGGLICIDFVGNAKTEAKMIIDCLNENLKDVKTEILPLSRFGVCEISRQKTAPSIIEYMNTKIGKALMAINILGETIKAAKGEMVILSCNNDLYEFINKWDFNWSEEISNKIGGRFELLKNSNTDLDFEVYNKANN